MTVPRCEVCNAELVDSGQVVFDIAGDMSCEVRIVPVTHCRACLVMLRAEEQVNGAAALADHGRWLADERARAQTRAVFGGLHEEGRPRPHESLAVLHADTGPADPCSILDEQPDPIDVEPIDVENELYPHVAHLHIQAGPVPWNVEDRRRLLQFLDDMHAALIRRR